MTHWPDDDTPLKMGIRQRVAVENLKCCPLCGAVNALVNKDCFVCGWSGRFDHNPNHIESGLSELLDQCPELIEAMTLDRRPTRPSMIERVRRFFRRHFRKPFELSA